jgi:hypothetical protein
MSHVKNMHGAGELNALTAENKALLGLEDSDSSEKIGKDDFERDFQSINEILKELNDDVPIFFNFK